MGVSFLFSFPLTSFLTYLYSLFRQPLCLFAFLLGDGLDHCLLYNVTNLRPFFRHSIRSNALLIHQLFQMAVFFKFKWKSPWTWDASSFRASLLIVSFDWVLNAPKPAACGHSFGPKLPLMWLALGCGGQAAGLFFLYLVSSSHFSDIFKTLWMEFSLTFISFHKKRGLKVNTS